MVLVNVVNYVLDRSLKETYHKGVGAGHVQCLEALVNQVSGLLLSLAQSISHAPLILNFKEVCVRENFLDLLFIQPCERTQMFSGSRTELAEVFWLREKVRCSVSSS